MDVRVERRQEEDVEVIRCVRNMSTCTVPVFRGCKGAHVKPKYSLYTVQYTSKSLSPTYNMNVITQCVVEYYPLRPLPSSSSLSSRNPISNSRLNLLSSLGSSCPTLPSCSTLGIAMPSSNSSSEAANHSSSPLPWDHRREKILMRRVRTDVGERADVEDIGM